MDLKDYFAKDLIKLMFKESNKFGGRNHNNQQFFNACVKIVDNKGWTIEEFVMWLVGRKLSILAEFYGNDGAGQFLTFNFIWEFPYDEGALTILDKNLEEIDTINI